MEKNISFKNKMILCPMAGITDYVYRNICKSMGVDILYTEMVSAKGLYYNDKNTHTLTKVSDRENPVGIQIFGSDPDIMAYVVENKINQMENIDIIDINMGCPAPKIVKNGDGSALMREPEKVKGIIRAVKKVSNKPITIKIRMGWDRNNINGIEIAKIAEYEGVNAITIHGRTRDMFYSGKADWDYIKKLKENIKVPVIGNGDIFTPEDGLDMINHTKCDGIGIGRGAMGNPWIFKGIKDLMEKGSYIQVKDEEKIDMSIKHLNNIVEDKGINGIKEMRKHIAWYLKGIRNSNEIKNIINTSLDKSEIIDILEKLKYGLE